MTDAAVSPPPVELVNVTKRMGGQAVLDGVAFAIPRGRITVLIGPSGAGKTVTIKHIVGLTRPSRGAVKVEGKDLARISDDELNALRREMAVVLQGALPFTCGLFYSLNVYENVAFPLRERNRWPEERVDRVTMDHLGMVGLRDSALAMPDQLSAGMTKRVALARALALNARIVIIDDFDSGIDGVRLALLTELIHDAQRRTGATYLVTTHDMNAARTLADHAVVINAGRIVAQGPADEVLSSDEPLVHQLVAGESEGPLELRG
jgi:phospholipid/cholesterol/gamma-HCH transport system ATP-binding protein